jgi:hypothetical protein
MTYHSISTEAGVVLIIEENPYCVRVSSRLDGGLLDSAALDETIEKLTEIRDRIKNDAALAPTGF